MSIVDITSGVYHARVRAYNESAASPWSDTFGPFTVELDEDSDDDMFGHRNGLYWETAIIVTFHLDLCTDLHKHYTLEATIGKGRIALVKRAVCRSTNGRLLINTTIHYSIQSYMPSSVCQRWIRIQKCW
jgi:hypothetical protein